MMLQALARGRLPVQVVGAAIAACGKHQRWQDALEFRSGRRELVGGCSCWCHHQILCMILGLETW